MALESAQNNGDYTNRFANGSFSGTYTAADFTLSLGFIPRYVKVVNLTDRVTQEWWEGMAFGDTLVTAANGDRSLNTSNAMEIENVGVGDQDGAAASGTGTSIPGTKPTGSVFVDVSVAGIMTDNDTVVWEARG